MSQKAKYISTNVLWTLLSTVITGAMLQTFMLERGIAENAVGQYVSLMQFVQMAVIIIFSKFVDRVNNIIGITAKSILLYFPLLVMMLVMCFTNGNFILFTAFGIIAYIAVGLYNVLCYKLPYHVMDMQYYGKWTGLSGSLAAMLMLALTSALALAQKKYGYFQTMKFFYPLIILAVIFFAGITASYKQINNIPIKEEMKTYPLMKYRRFTVLILPNLLRGFCAGIIGMAVTIGYASNKLDSSTASILIVITQSVSIVANYFYTKFNNKDAPLILIGSFGILCSVSLMGVLNSTGFLICYGIAYFSMMVINIAVPVFVTKTVDYQVVGRYNGWRILLNTAGTFAASVVCVPLLTKFGATALWITAGAMQVISGIAYYICSQKWKNTASE